MSFLARLCLSLGLLIAAIVATLWYFHRAGDQSLALLREQRREERARFFERALQLQGAGLETLTSSYSWWKEMVEFVAKPDPAWATQNVDNMVGVPNGGDAVWVVDPQFNVLHRIDADSGRPRPPFTDAAALRAHIGERFQFTYFTRFDGHLWQVFGAAIQDPNFWRHETPVQGYLLLAKRWDDAWVARIGMSTGAQLSILPPNAVVKLGLNQFVTQVHGVGGTPAATIVGTYQLGAVTGVAEAYHRQLLVLSSGLIGLVGLVAVLAWIMVVRPLSLIVRSLETRNALPMADLLSSKSSFGELARLLASHYRQGRMLQDELRRHLDAAKPALPDQDRESQEDLRLRLASDLHDGPLQSIYAAGLKLGALETRLQSGGRVAPSELEAIRASLRGCISDLRNLLFNLEPDDLRDQELESALDRLERYMQSIATRFELTIADHTLDDLGRAPQLDLYYICRELVSNASRHARPTHASLRFRRQEGFLQIEWSNDGVLASDGQPRLGNGLRNIGQRVARLGGTWQYRVNRGRTWVVTIELPYTNLASPATLEMPTDLAPPDRTLQP
ncbi:MAG TPA: CHASE4 domain-containing protein [Candidatus Synoicihabitans sp.]|nr:CHASE4 domain-containing protein [Candidatus Synoicihabitans sp.]